MKHELLAELNPETTRAAYLKNKGGIRGVLKLGVCLGPSFMIEDVRRQQAPEFRRQLH